MLGQQSQSFQWNKGQIVGRSAIIVVSLLLAMAVYAGAIGGSWVLAIAQWTASWTSLGLGWLGISTSVNGTILASDSFAVNVVTECTAIGPLLVFLGAVVAYPSRLRAKGIGALAGVVLISAVNLVRIISLFWIGDNYFEYLDIAHLLIWQTAIILFTIVLWLFWMERVAHAQHV